MKLKNNTMEALVMKFKSEETSRGRIALLLAAAFVVLVLVPVVAFGNTMIHNSTTLGSAKWGGDWGTATGMYGEFTCGTCHERNSGNIKRVKKDFVAPNSPAEQFPTEADPAVQVNFMDARESFSDFGDDTNAGRIADVGVATKSDKVCEACHSLTKFHNYDSTLNAANGGDLDHYNKADCMVCHPHSQGFKPLDCSACHGYPPTTNDNNGSTTTGLSHNPSVSGSVTAGAHATHAALTGITCEDCHNNYVMPQLSTVPGLTTQGDISISFNNFGSTTGTYSGQTGVSYNNVEGTGTVTCSTVYCHSTGQSADGTGTTPSAYSSPAWTGTAACGTCHSATDPATGSHSAHVAGTGCDSCHNDAVASTTVPTGIHVDGNISVYNSAVGDLGYTAGGAPGNGYGTCNTASCHDQGRGGLATTPTWGTATTDCSECHASAPATGGHTVHLAASIAGAAIACSDCHDAATDPSTETAPASGHRDTNIDVTVGGYPASKAKNTAFTTCSTAACHQTGQSTNDYTVTNLWDFDAANCTQCHAAVPATGSHATHVTTAGYDCSQCHTNATKDTSYNDANHGDVTIDVAVGNYITNRGDALYNSAYVSCDTIACHGDGLNAGGGNTPVWGASAGCAACHDTVNDGTGSHAKHLTYTGNSCAECHDNADVAGTAPGQHGDGNVDVYNSAVLDLGYPADRAIGSASWTGCTAASCHDDGRSANTTPNWGTAASNACTACHDTIPATGSHASHVADAAVDCLDCHAGAVAGTTKPSAGHDDGNIDTTAAHGYTQNKTKGSALETCATASCHDDGRNSGLTGTWGTTLNNCSECHATVPTTGGHSAHVGVSFAGAAIGCGDCHTGAAQGLTAPSEHRDGNVDAVGYTTANKTLGTAFTTCNTASCHRAGLDTVAANDYTVTPAWDADVANCTQCHAAVPGTGSHSAHVVDASADCSACHTNAIKDTSYNDANHGDVTIDVAVGNYITNRGNALYNSAYVSCDTIACHGDGLNAGGGNTPIWGAAAGCAACHLAAPTTGSHTIHLTETSGACVACHDDADPATENAPAQHGDGNIDVFNTAAGDLGYAQDAAIGAASWTSCNAASCHDQGRGGLATTPAWGAATTDCTECHAGAAIATGSHGAHISAGANCADCHDAATNPATETAPAAGHRDTNIDTQLAHGYTQDKAKDSAFTTCATASCHNDGRNSGLTGTWGTTLNNCSECHATQPATGSHTTHLALFNCATCHTGTTQGTTAGAGHRDGNIDVSAATGLATDKALSSAFVSCGTNNCHGSGSPVWGTDLSANDQCTQCHGQLVAGPATDSQKAPGGSGVDTNGDSLATDAQVGAHQIHLNPTMSAVVACSACHVVPGTVTAAGHIDSALPAELTFSGLALGGLDGQLAVAPAGCATTYCHDGAAIKNGWDGGTLAPVWTNTGFVTGAAADCDNCHGYPPPAAHPANSDCSVCHDVLNADDVTFTAAGKLTHVDGFVQSSGGDNCTDCHAADIDGAKSGVHNSHTDTATFLAGKTISGGNYGGAGWYTTTYVSGKPNFGCGECHPAAEGTGHPTAGLNLDLDPAGETPTGSRKALNTEGPITPTLISGSSVTCSNIYCHSDALAAGSRTYTTSPNWYGGAVSGNCNDCHANGPSTGTHTNHAVGIHYETLYDGGSNLMATSGTTGSGAAHGDAATADPISCQTCHNATVAVEYNASNAVCSSCHSDINAPVTGNEVMVINTLGSTHVNGQPDVVFSSLASFKSKAQVRDDITTVAELNTNWTRTNGYKAANSFDQSKVATPSYTAGSCSNVSCHNGISTPTWNTGFAGNCRACHTTLP